MRKLSLVLFFLVVCCIITPLSPSAASYQEAGSHATSLQFLESKGIADLERFGRSVTRAEFAMYIVRVLELPAMSTSRTYSDVKENHPYYQEIQTATAAGIIQGDTTTGKFQPAQPISRIHMVKMLTNALELLQITPQKIVQPSFKDTKGVSKDYASRIASTYSLGIITGDPAKNAFMPFQQATVAQCATFIARFYNVVDREGKWYSVANIVSGSYQLDDYYSSFDTAKKALQKGQVLLYKDTVYAMTSGVAYFNAYNQMKLPPNDAMAFASSTELDYVTSTASHVTLQIGDVQQAYAHGEVTLIPDGLHVPRSYYVVDGNELIHYVYKHVLNRYDSPYIVGEAPSFTKIGERYYSTDGIHFKTHKGEAAGTYYNYYQFMPFRVDSAYSANELNEIIAHVLMTIEKKGGRYTNASKNSVLIGLGDALKQAERFSHMNAALLLAIALYESDYGMNEAAQQQQNVIGSQAVLSLYSKKSYATAAESISNMAAYFSTEYMTPYDAQVASQHQSAYGSIVGSKAVGMNKKYTADSFWGAKVASIYRQFDIAFGAKDAKQALRMARIKPSKNGRVAVFKAANYEQLAYSYSRFQLPVAVYTIQGAYTKISADDPHFSHVYIPTAMLEHIQTTY